MHKVKGIIMRIKYSKELYLKKIAFRDQKKIFTKLKCLMFNINNDGYNLLYINILYI